MKRIIRLIITMSVVLTTISCSETESECIKCYEKHITGMKSHEAKVKTNMSHIHSYIPFLNEYGYWLYCPYDNFFVKDSTDITMTFCEEDNIIGDWFKRNKIKVLKEEFIQGYNCYTLRRKNISNKPKCFFMEFKAINGNWIKYTDHAFFITSMNEYNIGIGVIVDSKNHDRKWFEEKKININGINFYGLPFHGCIGYCEIFYFNPKDVKCIEETTQYDDYRYKTTNYNTNH